MTESRPFVCLTSQFALACNLMSVFLLLTLSDGVPGYFYPPVMLLYAPVLYLINRVFLSRERTMLSMTILNGLLCALVIAGYLVLNPWRGFAEFIFASAFVVWLTVRGCRFALDGPPLRSTLLTLDCSFLLLIAFSGYSSMMGWEFYWSIPSVCALASSILASASSRSPVTRTPKRAIAIGTSFTVLAGLIWLFLEILAVPAGSGLVTLWMLIVSGINTVKKLIFSFLLYLISLFPNAETGPVDSYEIPDFSLPEESVVQETSPLVGAVLFGVLAVCAVALLACLIRHLGRLRLRITSKKLPESKPKRERISFFKGLFHLLTSCINGIRLRIRLWNGRNTATGLYYLLVHRCRRSPWHKQPGETPREFLTRMAEAARADEKLSQALKKLVKETDAAFYAPCPASSPLTYAPMIRRRIGAAVRKQFVRDLVSRSPKHRS